MAIANRGYADVRVFMPAGRLTHVNSEAFGGELTLQIDECLKEGHAVVFDLSKLEFISSAGLRCFLQAVKQTKARNARSLFAALQPDVAEIFRISKFDRIFEVFPTLREALASASPSAAQAFERG
jgi:anti-anti-sigma factor